MLSLTLAGFDVEMARLVLFNGLALGIADALTSRFYGAG
jgi:hypothetical protein